MAANNKIQIQVEVAGANKAASDIKKIEVSSEDLKEGVKGIGENFKAVSETVASSNERMGLGISAVGDSIVGMSEAFAAFQASAGTGVMGLIGPLSILVGALGLAYEAFRQFSGAAREAQIWEEVMSATASDLTSRMEMLAEQGVKLTTAELKEFIHVNQAARIALETINARNEDLLKTYKEYADAQKQVNEIDKAAAKNKDILTKSYLDQIKALPELIALLWEVDDAYGSTVLGIQVEATDDLTAAREKLAKAEKAMADEYEKTLPMLQASLRMENALSKDQEGLLTDLRAAIYAKADADIAALEAQGKHNEALQVYKIATEQANIETKKRLDYIANLNQRVKDGKLEQEKANELLRETKFDTYDITQGYIKYTEAVNRNNEGVLRGAQARDKARELFEKATTREITLMKLNAEIAKNIEEDELSRKYNIQSKEIAIDRTDRERLKSAVTFRKQSLALLQEQFEAIGLLGSQKDFPEFYSKYVENSELNNRTLKTILDKSIDDLAEFQYGSEILYSAEIDTTKLYYTTNNELLKQTTETMDEFSAFKFATRKRELIAAKEQALAELKLEQDKKVRQAQALIIEQNFTRDVQALGIERRDYVIAELKQLADQQLAKEELVYAHEKKSRDLVATGKILKEQRDRDTEYYEEALLKQSVLRNQLVQIEQSEHNKKLLEIDIDLAKKQFDIDDRTIQAKIAHNEKLINLAEVQQDYVASQELFANQKTLNFERDFILKQQDIKNQAFTQQKRSLLLQTKAVAEAMQAQRDAVKGFYEDLNEDALIGFMDKITTSVVGVEESRRRSLVRQAAEELQAAIDREEIAVKSLEADKLRHKLQMESAEAAKKSILEPLKPLGDTLEHLISIKALNSDINHLTSEQADTLEFLITQYSEDYDAMFSGVQEDLDLANKTMGGIKQLQINTEKDLREARTESLRLSLEQQRVYAEKIAEQWAGIGEAITGSISGATQSMMTEIATLIYDDSADQKRKDLNKARKAELKAFKGTMQERMDIEKKYAEEKKALDEEEANRLPNILKATLRNLAIEATGKALFEGAAALASLAIRDFEGAALHGKSAAAYGIVAGVMGSATLLAGGPTNAASGGGTVAGSSTTSPTGLSQTGVNREEAKSNEPVVFNINFAGANIYDSREAALRALSNEIFRVGQQSQRGSRFIPRGV